MTETNFRFLRTELKKTLKARKVKYHVLAKRLGVSESGIKKMLNADDLSFNKISAILSACEVNVPDFFRLIDEKNPRALNLSQKQEEFFLKNPHFFHFFHQLLEIELDWRKLKDNHRLSQKSVDQYLLKLDRLGLIELHPGNVIKSDFAGNVHMNFGMKLVKLVMDQKHKALLDFAHIPKEEFRGRKYLSSGSIKLNAATAAELQKSLREVMKEYMRKSTREKVMGAGKNLEEIGFLLVVTPTKGMPYEPVPNLG